MHNFLVLLIIFQSVVLTFLTLQLIEDIFDFSFHSLRTWIKHNIIYPLQLFVFWCVCFVLMSWVRLKMFLKR